MVTVAFTGMRTFRCPAAYSSSPSSSPAASRSAGRRRRLKSSAATRRASRASATTCRTLAAVGSRESWPSRRPAPMLKLLESGDHGLDLGAPVIPMLCERQRWKCSPRTFVQFLPRLAVGQFRGRIGQAGEGRDGRAWRRPSGGRGRRSSRIDSQSCLALENGVKVVLMYFAPTRCWCRPGSSARTRPVVFASAWPTPMT